MKKIMTFAFLAMTAAAANAQEYVTAWHTDGSAEVMQLASIDSLTFTAPQGSVVVTTGQPVSVSNTSLKVLCSVATPVPVSGGGAERGVCYSQSNPEPTVDGFTVVDGAPKAGTWFATIDGLTSGNTCYYRAYVKVGGKTYYGNVRSAKAGGSIGFVADAPVDLGLSVQWSSSNLAAAAAKAGLSTYGLSDTKVYAISTKRGGWYVDTQMKSTGQASATPSATDTKQQFAFVTDPNDNSVFYLYSVGAGKFVKKNGSLSANSPDRIYIFATNDNTYPLQFSFTADKSGSNINIGGGNQMTIDTWSRADDGNKCKFDESTATYDLAAARAMITNATVTASKLSYGALFAWGETASKDNYQWTSYALGNGTSRTKYNATDGKKTLEAADDAATVLLGDGWRLPTPEEFEELKTKCTWTWETTDNVSGYRVVGPNGNSIFLPAAGFRLVQRTNVQGEYGYYLTNTLGTSDANAVSYGIMEGKPAWKYETERFLGYSIRPVHNK